MPGAAAFNENRDSIIPPGEQYTNENVIYSALVSEAGTAGQNVAASFEGHIYDAGVGPCVFARGSDNMALSGRHQNKYSKKIARNQYIIGHV